MWVEQYPQKNAGVTAPYARHTTWQRCPEAKINRLRDDSLWLLDGADRYEHPVGFISYEPEIADSLLQAAAAHVRLRWGVEARV